MKLSPGKVIYPDRKEVYRVERDGSYVHDVLARRGETLEEPGEPQLETIFEDGSLVYTPPDLRSIREWTGRELEKLPERYRRVRDSETYEVRISDGLEDITRETERAIRDREL